MIPHFVKKAADNRLPPTPETILCLADGPIQAKTARYFGAAAGDPQGVHTKENNRR
jgi:hypothetical protein